MSRVLAIFSVVLLASVVLSGSVPNPKAADTITLVTTGSPSLFTCPRAYGQFSTPNCSQFYNCWNGSYYIQDCPQGFYFNPTKQWCDYPGNVDCTGRLTTPGPPTLFACPRPYGQFAAANCSQFYNCWENRSYPVQDCPFGFYFNTSKMWCDYPGNVDCTGRLTTPGILKLYNCSRPYGQFPTPNCSQYYNCWEGRSYIQNCPKGFYFNTQKQWCDWPENVNCTGVARANRMDLLARGPLGLFTCPLPNGKFSTPTCNQFFNCLDGRPYIQECPKGYYFNPPKQACDWPVNVNCAGRQT